MPSCVLLQCSSLETRLRKSQSCRFSFALSFFREGKHKAFFIWETLVLSGCESNSFDFYIVFLEFLSEHISLLFRVSHWGVSRFVFSSAAAAGNQSFAFVLLSSAILLREIRMKAKEWMEKNQDGMRMVGFVSCIIRI